MTYDYGLLGKLLWMTDYPVVYLLDSLRMMPKWPFPPVKKKLRVFGLLPDNARERQSTLLRLRLASVMVRLCTPEREGRREGER